MTDEVDEVKNIAYKMIGRAADGHAKYKDSYKEKDMFKEAEEELADLFNYMIFEYVKIKERLNGLSNTNS